LHHLKLSWEEFDGSDCQAQATYNICVLQQFIILAMTLLDDRATMNNAGERKNLSGNLKEEHHVNDESARRKIQQALVAWK
jgi:hypothetical protein